MYCSSLHFTADAGGVSVIHYTLSHAVIATSLVQVPSLLSLGSLDHLGNSGGSVYRQHSGYGPGRFQDPGPNRRKRMESRRQEPYSKVRVLLHALASHPGVLKVI